MAVLIEGISVVVRVDAIVACHEGGISRFLSEIPNPTLCADGKLARIGFMTPDDTESYVRHLEGRGLQYVDGGAAVDIVVVDQREGPRANCSWVNFGHTDWKGDPNCVVALCSFAGGESSAQTDKLVVPKGWSFENSLSSTHTFVESGNIPPNLSFIRNEGGLDIYWDGDNNRELYVSRS